MLQYISFFCSSTRRWKQKCLRADQEGLVLQAVEAAGQDLKADQDHRALQKAEAADHQSQDHLGQDPQGQDQEEAGAAKRLSSFLFNLIFFIVF